MLKFISNCEAETQTLGERWGAAFKPGCVVALYGGMGAGKTALVRGIAKGMGFDGRVTSPTYAIVNEYPSSTPLFHFDLYRLGYSDELYDIGFEEYLSRGGVCVIEWFERAEDAFDWDVKISITADAQDADRREFLLETRGCMTDEDFGN